MFQCDTLWCCWLDLLASIRHGFWMMRWPLAIYATLYVIGAASFLLTLRLKSADGRLVVDKDSWAYAIAHPLRYGGHRNQPTKTSSICVFYATMFNMLLFAWPGLLLYFILMLTVGNFFALISASTAIWPNLHNAGFCDYKHLITTKNGGPFPMVLISVPLALFAIAGWKFTTLVHILAVGGWAALCLAPVLLVIGIVVVVILKSRAEEPNTVTAVLEVVSAKKEKFCKLVEFQ